MDGRNPGLVDRGDEVRSRELNQEYLNFLDDSSGAKVYSQKVEELIQEENTRLIINLDDVRNKFADRAAGLLHRFIDEIIPLEQALRETVARVDPTYAKNKEFHVGFEGSFGDRHVNPRTLKATLLGNLVCAEGIVTKCSSVHPKVVRSVHYCAATKKTLERRYTDLTSYEGVQSSNAYPTEDDNKNPLETEFGLSTYKNHQTFSIQEMPESAPAGQLPRTVEVVADDDLADRCKPGDRVRVVGLFRCLPNKQNGFSSGSFRSILIANNIQLLSKEQEPNFQPGDFRLISRISKQKNVVDLLARSLAPSIFGHLEVKKAILCLMLGGQEKLLENGSRLRGDVNVLLIGDPSVAKSQLLRYVLHTAPRALTTTGRGSSGVGLTAAVTTDPETGERRLEAGAMVLADRGIVCVDEFDKMSDLDRTAMHEVMEQGRVTVSKAGIHARLNARCSVLAAANPVYGRYDPLKSPLENINMQDSLLSRFDLIFVLLDEHESARDKNIAEHVVRLHRYRAAGEPDGTVLPMGVAVETLSTFDLDNEPTDGNREDIWEKDVAWTGSADAKNKILSLSFMRKYIHLARAMTTKLSEEATEFISEAYAEIRSAETSKPDCDRTMPITARQLETLIRLSTAMAKARLSKTVTRADAEAAYELLHFACFKEKPRERVEYEGRKKGARSAQSTDSDEGIEDDREILPVSTRAKRRAAARIDEDAEQDVDEVEAEEEESADLPQTSAPRPKRVRPDESAAATAAISVDRLKTFKRHLRSACDELKAQDEPVLVESVTGVIQRLAGRLPFSAGELKAAYEQMEADNVLMMMSDGKMMLI